MTQDGFIEFLKKDQERKQKRPGMLPEIVQIFEHEDARIPERLRVSFGDGTTAVYDLHTEQPAPLIIENIRIIRKMKQGYVNQPEIRRRRRG